MPAEWFTETADEEAGEASGLARLTSWPVAKVSGALRLSVDDDMERMAAFGRVGVGGWSRERLYWTGVGRGSRAVRRRE